MNVNTQPPNPLQAQGITGAPTRNSSIELLRLACILMVVGFPYVLVSANEWLAQQPITVSKIACQMIMAGGWIGNFVFFTISMWFLIDRDATLRSSLKRIWILERELLFWSITLFAATAFLRHRGINAPGPSLSTLAERSALPISMTLWWYPTAYALFLFFLFFLPFLNDCMRRLTARRHQQLAFGCLLLWGVLGMIPRFDYDLGYNTVFLLIYWYILISCYRWHMREFSTRACWLLIGGGIAIELAYLLGGNLYYAHTGTAIDLQWFIFDKGTLTSMMIGFGMFLLVSRTDIRSRFVNVLAASAFGVYLIQYYPPIFLAWLDAFPFQRMYNSPHPVPSVLTVIIGVFLVCLLLDLVQQAIFKLTCDRHRGRLFDRVYSAAHNKWVSIRDSRQESLLNS